MDDAIGGAVQRLVTESTLLVLFLVLSDIVLLLTIRWLATELKEARQSHIGSLEKHAEVAERSAIALEQLHASITVLISMHSQGGER